MEGDTMKTTGEYYHIIKAAQHLKAAYSMTGDPELLHAADRIKEIAVKKRSQEIMQNVLSPKHFASNAKSD